MTEQQQMQIFGTPEAGARFDESRRYRWLLWRQWDDASTVLWWLLNPSTADEVTLDPTLRICRNFTRRWGYGRMEIVNMYGLRSTDPKGLWKVEDPVGSDNDITIVERIRLAEVIVVGWGRNAKSERVQQMMELVPRDRELLCFGINKDGSPVHPLYQPRDALPITWTRR